MSEPKIVTRLTRPGYHLCDVPHTSGYPVGTVAECPLCGTWWILRRLQYGTKDWEHASWTERRMIRRQLKRAKTSGGEPADGA